MLPPLSAPLGLLCCGVMISFSTILTASAQTISPFSTEYNISGALPGDQVDPAASIGPEGGVLTWQDNRIDGPNGTGIAAVRLDADLNPTGPIFRVNDKVQGDQEHPAAVRLLSGSTLLVWQSKYKAGQQVYARVMNPDGSFLGKSVQVSPAGSTNVHRYKTNWLSWVRTRFLMRPYRITDRIITLREGSGSASAAALPDGGAVVVYHSRHRHETNSWTLSHGSSVDHLEPKRTAVDLMQDIYLQRLSASGQKVGSEILVNQYAWFNQRTPAVTTLADGRIVVAWVCERPRSSNPEDNFLVVLCARVFNSAGEPLTDEFQVNGADELLCANPAVAPLANGGFVVAWSRQEAAVDPLLNPTILTVRASADALKQRWDVYARTFDGNANPAGAPELVNVATAGNQFGPSLSASGNTVVAVWTSADETGSAKRVYARALDAGAPAGAELEVNPSPDTHRGPPHPTVTSDGQGRFLTIWTSYMGETGLDLFAQQWR